MHIELINPQMPIDIAKQEHACLGFIEKQRLALHGHPTLRGKCKSSQVIN